MFTISARTIRGPAGRNFPVQDSDMTGVMSDFESMLTDIMGGQLNARSRGGFPGPMLGMFPFPGGQPPGFDNFGPGRNTRTATERFTQQGDQPPQTQGGSIQE